MRFVHLIGFVSGLTCAAGQAQTCSGGADGGTDATGNQCSAAQEIADSVSSSTALVRVVTAIVAQMQTHATAARSSTAVLAIAAPSRPPIAGTLPVVPTAGVEAGKAQEGSCSGGAGGGMDANGNECDAAGETLVAHVVNR